jgi:LPXTG-motif cell wall-anchored protein
MYMGTNNLGDLGKTSPTKAAAKLQKIAAKEAKHDAKIAAKLVKYGEGSAKAAKVLAKEAKHDAKLQKKVDKFAAIAQSVLAPPSTVPAITPSPSPVSVSTPATVSPMPQVSPPVPSIAPVPAAESFAPTLSTPPNLYTPAPTATPDTSAAPAAPADSGSNMPLILGAAALGLGALFLLGKKKRG